MAIWTETEPREYTTMVGTYTLSVQLSLFGGAIYVVRCARHILGKGDMPTVGAAMRKAEEIVATLEPDGMVPDVAP